MSYGIQIQNASGNLIIDGEFRNHAVMASGSATTGSLAGFVLDSKVVKVSLGTAIALSRSPMIWGRIGADNAWMGLVGLEVNGSSELTGFWLGSDNAYGTGPARTIEWRVTAAPASGSGLSHGMQVFDATGARVFDSGLDYLDIAHVSSAFTLTTDWPVGTLITYPSLANPWYCLSGIAYLRTTSPSFDDTHWECAMVARVSATSSRVVVYPYAYVAGDFFYSNIGGGTQQRQLVLAK